MEIIKKPLTNGQYITDVFTKRSIFLHHTVGLNANSAWRWWNNTPERVGTPYIIDRDGTIIECFNPKYWAYHLGIKNDDNFHEKHSINIEIVSAGPLKKVNKEFRFYPLWPNKIRFSKIPKNQVIKYSNMWRGHEYFHKYTAKQMEALKFLLLHIYAYFPSIPYEDIKPESIFDYNEDILNNHLGGIWSHSAVRADKSDPYPDRRIIEVIGAVKDELSSINKPIITKKKTNLKKQG